MSTELSTLRSWAAELAATETYIRATLQGSLSPGGVRRVEADAVSISDHLLTRAGFDPDDLAFAAGVWQPAPEIAEARPAEEHTDELLSAALSGAAADQEFAAEEDVEGDTDLDAILGLEIGAGGSTDGWITYDEPGGESASASSFAESDDQWVQFEDDEVPTHTGSLPPEPQPVPLAGSLTAARAQSPTPSPRAEAGPKSSSAKPRYLADEEEDSDADDQEDDQVTGVFERVAPSPMSPAKLDKGGISVRPASLVPVAIQDESAREHEEMATPIPATGRTRAGKPAPGPVATPPPIASERAARQARPVAAEEPEFEAVVDELDVGGQVTENGEDMPSDSEVVQSSSVKVSLPTAKAGKAAIATPTPPQGASVRTSAAGSGRGATAGLYGGASVPTIRDSGDPRPKAAAIQLNAAAGSSKVVRTEEEEEPLEIGSAEDFGEDEPEADGNSGGGFRVNFQEYEEVEVEEEEEEEDEELELDQTTGSLAVPLQVVSGPSVAEISEMLGKARTAEEGGMLDDGIALYADVLDADPENIDARVGRGRLHLDRGDFARAMSDFMVAEEIGPKHPEPQIAMGDLHFARKDYLKAVEYFDLALSLAPKSAKAYCRRGISHYWRKAYPQALSDLTTAQKLDPDTANIGTYITMVRKKMKK